MESITITRSVQVSLNELQPQDIKDMSQRDEVEDVALKLLHWCNELSSEINVLKTSPVEIEEPLVEEATLFDAEDPVVPVVEHKERTHCGDSHIGFKYGKTSKYHYVSFNKANKKNPWNAVVKINGKNHSKYFATEIEAAVAVDDQLDFLQDKKRPRNKDEFKEIMAAYKSQQQQEKK